MKTDTDHDAVPVDGESLDLESFSAIVIDRRHARLASSARDRVQSGRRAVEGKLDDGEVIYGINTGFGNLASVRIDSDKLQQLQEKLILSHAAGTGEALPDDAVRGMLLLRANTLARGHSGVRDILIDHLLQLLNQDCLPLVPSRGSVGASGDLAPLAHLALPLIGRGRMRLEGRLVDAGEGLAAAGLTPLKLEAKEGLALINGTQAMTSLLGMSCLRSRRLLAHADLIAAMSCDALRGTDTAFDPRLHAVRPHPGQIRSAANLHSYLAKSEIRASHRQDDIRIQDPYCLRCAPQVHGAVRDVLADVERKTVIEMNAVTDNPLVFPDAGEVLSGGNFHGEILAFAGDFLAVAVAELAGISERRIEKLTNEAFSALPPFLVPDAGLNSGFMIAQVTAAALVSENKTLAHPASVDSIPTSADKEDHVSMGMWSMLKLQRVLENCETVLAIELLAAAQGIDLLRPLRSGAKIEEIHAALRRRIDRWDEDREMHTDIEAALDFLRKLPATGDAN